MKSLLIATILLALLSGNCHARSTDGSWGYSGIGVVSCGKLTTKIAENDRCRDALDNYISGFISGFNFAAENGIKNIKQGIDQEANYKFVLNYCEENPLDDVAIGIRRLIGILEVKQKY